MVEEEVTDGRRIAQLLSSELHGRGDGGLDRVSVVDADPDVEPSTDGALAYRLETTGGDRLGAAYVHPDRVRLSFRAGVEAAAAAAAQRDLRVRPKGVEPPRTLVFVEWGAETKRAADVVGVVARESA
jgi:hypothetical protein